MSEQEAEAQFAALQMTMGPASRMPDELKDAIRWAEEQKKKHRMN